MRDHGTWSKHLIVRQSIDIIPFPINPLNAELNPICHLLALLRGATIVVLSRLRVKYAETIYVLRSTEICMLPTPTVEEQKVPPRMESSPLFN